MLSSMPMYICQLKPEPDEDNSLIEKVPTEELSYDGVHLSDPGCAIMAKEYLKAWATIEK